MHSAISKEFHEHLGKNGRGFTQPPNYLGKLFEMRISFLAVERVIRCVLMLDYIPTYTCRPD